MGNINKKGTKKPKRNFNRRKSITEIHEFAWAKNEAFIDFEKFASDYKDFKEEQDVILIPWLTRDFQEIPRARPTEDCLVSDWKKDLRRGLPFMFWKKFIWSLFCCDVKLAEAEFVLVTNTAFKGNIPNKFRNMPGFIGSEKLDDTLKYLYLNKKGKQYLEELLWTFSKTVQGLEYCPMLVISLSLMLVLLNQAETYCIMNKMIRSSLENLHNTRTLTDCHLKFHFVFTKAEFEKLNDLFVSYCQSKYNWKTIEKHFNEINFNYCNLFHHWISRIFIGYLPIKIVLRIYLAYLNEGIKIFFMFGYGLLKVFKKEVAQIRDPTKIEEFYKLAGMRITIEQEAILFQKAYKQNIEKIKQSFTGSSFTQIKPDKIYLPLAENKSGLISNHQNPELIYSNKRDGSSLNTLYALSKEREQKGHLILILSDNDRIFGAFIDSHFSISSMPAGTNDSFLFIIQPSEIIYKSTGRDKNFLICSKEKISIGGGGGAAIVIYADLSSGNTYKSDTFDNDRLNGNTEDQTSKFDCQAIELFALA